MAYTKTTFIDNSAPAITAAELNKIGTALEEVYTNASSEAMNNKANAGLGTSSETDFNNIVTAGWYWINPNTTVSNNPSSNYGILEVITYTGNTGTIKLQRFSEFINGDTKYPVLWERLYVNGNWTQWKKATYPNVLPISEGGTGATTASSARTNLGITPSNIGAAPSSHTHSTSDINSGTLPVSRGGTGQTSIQATRNAMGLGNTTGALPIANGGTGAASASTAWTNLGGGSIGKKNVLVASDIPDLPATKIATGVIPVARGGTGASTLTGSGSLREAMGLGTGNSSLGVAFGGTGANNKKSAKNNLGITYGTSAPSGGADGDIYFRYS